MTYSWELIRTDTDEVIMAKPWITSTSVDIDANTLTSALAQLDGVELAQLVTTSDTFHIVQSAKTTTNITITASSGGNSGGSSGNNSGSTNSPATSSSSDSSSGGAIQYLLYLLAGACALRRRQQVA